MEQVPSNDPEEGKEANEGMDEQEKPSVPAENDELKGGDADNANKD